MFATSAVLTMSSLFAGFALPATFERIPPRVLDICAAAGPAGRPDTPRPDHCHMPDVPEVCLPASTAVSAQSVRPGESPVVMPRAVAFGTSVGGAPLTVERRQGPGPVHVTVMVVGVVHGQEDAGRGVVDHLRCLDVPAGVELVLVPTLNPDGEQVAAVEQSDPYDTDGVHNHNGVNLNRNFPSSDWQTGTYFSTGHYHSGPEAGSEVETQAFMRLAHAVQPDVTISFHQPWNVIDAAPGLRSAVRYGELVGMDVDYEHRPGTLTGWMHEQGLGESFVVEFDVNDPTAEETLLHAQAILTVAREHPKPPVWDALRRAETAHSGH